MIEVVRFTIQSVKYNRNLSEVRFRHFEFECLQEIGWPWKRFTIGGICIKLHFWPKLKVNEILFLKTRRLRITDYLNYVDTVVVVMMMISTTTNK